MSSLSVSFSDVEQAAVRLESIARRTPLIENDALNEQVGKRVLVKLECLQHTGSFKWRGAWNALMTMHERTPGAGGVIAYSSGNHAQGVARAAKRLGIPAVIVMPEDAPAVKIRNTRGYGAEVVFYDRARGESREAVGEALAEARGLTLIRPYDDVNVIAGQGTCGLEIAAQAAELGVDTASVLVCCGGGGLTSGIAIALHGFKPDEGHNTNRNTESGGPAGFCVRPVEPELADDVCRSLVSGKRESLSSVPNSVCDAIITPSPGELTFPIMAELCGGGLTVSEEDAIEAVRFAFDQLRVVAEPGGAVALAAALKHGSQDSADAIVVVITGGNVDPVWLAGVLSG